MPTNKQIEFTHGVRLTSVEPKDCISRTMQVAYSESEDKYWVEITTQWAADTQPVFTRIRLSENGIELLIDALMRMTADRENYRLAMGSK